MNKVIDKELLLKLRDQDNLQFKDIAKVFHCTKQGAHNCYYRAKAKSLLPITVHVKRMEYYELHTMRDVMKECRAKGMTLPEFVNEEVAERIFEAGDE
jgi:galactose-1-phosphate uridylyltransferase